MTQDDRTAAAHAAAQTPIRRIVAGTDLMAESRFVIPRALSIAEASGASLVVAHVLDEPGDETTDYAAMARKQLARAVEAERPGDVQPDQEVRAGVPGAVLEQLADDHDADLLVLGYHQDRAFEQERFGSTMQHVLTHTERDVLLVRQDGRQPYRSVLVAWDGEKSLAAVLARARVHAGDAQITVFRNVGLASEVDAARSALEAAPGSDNTLVTSGSLLENLRDVIRERRTDLLLVPTRGNQGGDLSYLSSEILRHRLCDTLCCHASIGA